MFPARWREKAAWFVLGLRNRWLSLVCLVCLVCLACEIGGCPWFAPDCTARLVAPIVAQSLEYDAEGNLSREWKAGDMNCDGQVNANDMDAFNLAMTDCNDYAVQYPNCNLHERGH